jgi:hypothetical protein
MDKILFDINQIDNYELLTNLFIEKLCWVFKNTKFTKFIEESDKILNSLINICVKNKINFYIDNHISFSSINLNFKTELENFLHQYAKLVYPNIDSNINNVFVEDLDLWVDIDTILSKFIDNKNKVSFNSIATKHTYSNDKSKQKKSKPVHIKIFSSKQTELSLSQKISLYFYIILFFNLDLSKLVNKIILLTNVIGNPNIEYDILCPYKS